MEALQSIGQFFARWLAQLETTFVEKQRYLLLVDGLKNTLIITAGALVIGVVIGSLVAMIKYCGQDSRLLRPLCWLCSVYTTVIRGVPVVVQLLIFYFLILKSSDGLVVGIVTFGINSGAWQSNKLEKKEAGHRPMWRSWCAAASPPWTRARWRPGEAWACPGCRVPGTLCCPRP